VAVGRDGCSALRGAGAEDAPPSPERRSEAAEEPAPAAAPTGPCPRVGAADGRCAAAVGLARAGWLREAARGGRAAAGHAGGSVSGASRAAVGSVGVKLTRGVEAHPWKSMGVKPTRGECGGEAHPWRSMGVKPTRGGAWG